MYVHVHACMKYHLGIVLNNETKTVDMIEVMRYQYVLCTCTSGEDVLQVETN